MNYSRHLLCDLYQSKPTFMYNTLKKADTTEYLTSPSPKKGRKSPLKEGKSPQNRVLTPRARNSIIQKFPSQIPYYRKVSFSNVGGSVTPAVTTTNLWRRWLRHYDRDDITDPQGPFVDDRLSLLKDPDNFPEGAFFDDMVKEVYRHVLN